MVHLDETFQKDGCNKTNSTDLSDLARVVGSSRDGEMVDAFGHVNNNLIPMHGDRWASSLLQGQDNNCGVVGAKHALFPKQKRWAPQAACAGHPLWSLRDKEGNQNSRRTKRSRRAFESNWNCSHYMLVRISAKNNNNTTHHHLVVAITHIDCILWWHHIPQSITAEDDVAMSFGVKGYHCCIRFWWYHKLPTVEIVAPEITFQQTRKGYTF